MRFHRRPMKDRLKALAHGYLAEYKSFATLPVTVYLGDYPADLERLAYLVEYPVRAMGDLTCRGVADRIRDMRRYGSADADEATAIMAKPLIDL